MNDILAENRFSLSWKLFQEGMRAVTADSYGSSVRKLLIGLAALWLALSAWTLIRGAGLSYVLAELAVLAALTLWLELLLPRSRAKRAWRKLEEQGRADAERTTHFYGDHLEVASAGAVKTVAYADLRKTLRSKSLLVLVAEDKTGVLIKKDAFTLGTEETVLRLIEAARESGGTADPIP